MTATELTYFEATGFFYDVEAPLTGGTTNADQFNGLTGAFVTFKPRVPDGFTVLIDNLDLGGGNTGSTAVALPAITGRVLGTTINGASVWQLATINTTDTPGIQLLANSAPISESLAAQGITSLIYDVEFSQVTFAGANQYLTNFAFVAPTDTTGVCITDPDTARIAYGGSAPAVALPDGVTSFGTSLIAAASENAARGVLDLPAYNVDSYGGDNTGAAASDTAVAAIITAMGSNPGVVEFGSGTYKLASTHTLAALQGIKGQGSGVTTIKFTGTGDCFRVYDAAHTGGPPPAQGAPITGFTIEGSTAGAASSGLHIGDLQGTSITDLTIQDFTGAGSIGLWLHNVGSFFEKSDVNAFIVNCTNAAVFDAASQATSSFDYDTFDLKIIAFANQNAVVIRNDASLYHSTLAIRGNMLNCHNTGGLSGGWTAATTNTGTVLTVSTGSGDTANITACTLNIAVENGGITGSPTLACHKTIVIGDGSYGVGGVGLVDFLNNSGFAWQNGTGGMNFAGWSNVDSVFGTMSGYQSFTVNGPITTVHGWAYESPTILLTSNVMYVLLVNGATTVTVSAPAGASGTAVYELLIFQPGSGAAGTITWPSNVHWMGAASAPTLSATNNAVDLVRLYTVDHTTFYAYKAA